MNTNIDILKDKLQDRDEEMEVARLKFEKHFGINSSVRNKKQWNNLVIVYGVETVMLQEEMTEDEINQRCNETFSERLKRQMKNA